MNHRKKQQINRQPFEKFLEADKTQRAKISLDSFFTLEICCKQEIGYVYNLEGENKKSQKNTIVLELFLILEICCKQEIGYVYKLKRGYFDHFE